MTDLPRSMQLQGTSNLRDLGGYHTTDGHTVRLGRIFRSARLSALTDADGATLRAAGIGRIADLRGPAEQRDAPTRLAGVTIHDLSIDPSIGPALRDLADQGEAARPGIMRVMSEAYAAYALTWHHRYATLFDLLLEPDAPALLFHCTAGKDRTGFAAALILAALGVDRATIQADYLATTHLWTGRAEIGQTLAPVVAEILTSVHPDFLAAAFTAIEQSHGSVPTYLAEKIGMGPARIATLRDMLLV